MDDDRDNFIKEKEEQYNGKLAFLSFAKLLGFSGLNNPKNLSGLMYIINDILYFEDFKPNPSPLLRQNNTKFTKYNFCIPLNEIDRIINVKESDASRCLKKLLNYTQLTELTGKIYNLLHRSVSMFITKNSEAIFFDISEIKKLPIL